MKLDQYIALSALVVSALSAIATLLTIRQMVKQRNATYQPELVIARSLFTVRRRAGDDNGLPSVWNEGANSLMESENPKVHTPTLNLWNIGLGAAHSIEGYWDFPVEEFVKKVNSVSQQALASRYVNFKDGYIEFKSEKGGNKFSLWNNQIKFEIDYARPSSSDTVYISLPDAYCALCVQYFIYGLRNHGEEPLSVPELQLKLRFKDISGRDIIKSYSISTDMKKAEGDPIESITFMFKPEKVMKTYELLSITKSMLSNYIRNVDLFRFSFNII